MTRRDNSIIRVALILACESAAGEWEGLEWCEEFRYGDDDDVVDAEDYATCRSADEVRAALPCGAEDMAEEIWDRIRAVRESAEDADESGAACADAARRGDPDAAVEAARDAANAESQYGDDPTWGSVRLLSELWHRNLPRRWWNLSWPEDGFVERAETMGPTARASRLSEVAA